MEILLNSERQKQKVEGIQRLLDVLKNLQKEEKGYDQLIKQMFVQISQTTQAIDGLKERLAHCTSALGVLGSMGRAVSADGKQEAVEDGKITQPETEPRESGVGNKAQLVSIDLKESSEQGGEGTDTKVEVTTGQPGTTAFIPGGDTSQECSAHFLQGSTDLVAIVDSAAVVDITEHFHKETSITHVSKEDVTFVEQPSRIQLSQESIESSQPGSSQGLSEISLEMSESQ